MSGIVSAIFGSVGGSSAKRDRAEQLKSYGDLSNVFSWGLPFGQQQAARGAATTEAGVGDIGQASSYFKRLLGGNRADMLQAVAPETAAVQSQEDARKRQLAASGTARGGGVAATNQQAQQDTLAKLDQYIFGVRPGAAGEVGKLGAQESAIGLGETGEGLKAAGLAESAGYGLGELAGKSRKESAELHQQSVDDWTNAFEDVLSMGFGGASKVPSYLT